MSSVKDWVQRYIDLGMSPLPILPRSKAPKDEAWQKLTYGPADFDDDANVGIHLGQGVVDVDLDSPEARALAPHFLPQTVIFGRASSPAAHWVYLVKGLFGLLRWNGIGGNDDCLLELRGINEGTGTPAQTVFPPSIHKDTGELIMFEGITLPSELPMPFDVEPEYLRHRGRLLALAVLLARHSAGPGKRHDFRLGMAGFLIKCGLTDKDVMLVGRAVTQYTGGEVKDWETTGRSTLAKFKSDPTAKISGALLLKECMVDGDKVMRKLNAFLGRKEQAAKDDVIDELNARYAVVTIGGTCCVMDDSHADGITFLTHDNFRKFFAKRTLPPTKSKDRVDKGGAVIEGKFKEGQPIADFWLKHPDGRHFERLVYAPPPLTAGPKDYNGWRGFAVEPRQGDWSLIYRHIEHVMCRDDQTVFSWVINWAAALLQKPGLPGVSAIVLKGAQGTGKGFFAEDLLGAMFDKRHFIKMSSSEQFYGRFAGETLSGKCLVFLDEATWGGDKKDRGILKDRITSKTIHVDRKGIAAVNEPSMLHTIIASNEEWIVGLDGDDRRFVILEHDAAFAQNDQWFDPLYEQLKNGGREAFLHAMLEWPVDEKLLRQPPRTTAKDRMKQLGLSSWQTWLLDRLAEGSLSTILGWPEFVQVTVLFELYLEWAKRVNARNIVTSAVDFGRKTGDYLFDGKTIPKRVDKHLVRVGKLRSLVDARAFWDTKMKSQTTWEDGHVSTPMDF